MSKKGNFQKNFLAVITTILIILLIILALYWNRGLLPGGTSTVTITTSSFTTSTGSSLTFTQGVCIQIGGQYSISLGGPINIIHGTLGSWVASFNIANLTVLVQAAKIVAGIPQTPIFSATLITGSGNFNHGNIYWNFTVPSAPTGFNFVFYWFQSGVQACNDAYTITVV